MNYDFDLIVIGSELGVQLEPTTLLPWARRLRFLKKVMLVASVQIGPVFQQKPC